MIEGAFIITLELLVGPKWSIGYIAARLRWLDIA